MKKVPPPTPETALVNVPVEKFPFFKDDMGLDQLETAVSQSLKYLKMVSPDKIFRFGPDVYSASHVIRSLSLFLDKIRTHPSPRVLGDFILKNYRIYRSSGKDETGEVLFTGYYEPLLNGSRKQTKVYQYPVYGRPNDLITIDLGQFRKKFKGERLTGRLHGTKLVPYHDRFDIDQKDVIKKKAPVLAWVDDQVALFFLHIQGSGRIRLSSDETINVHYDGTNGHPYRSIGRLLIDQGAILKENMSMQAIRQYLNAHPKEMTPVFKHNPSYVFFSIEKEGPLGALNVPLTAGRSLATDRRLFPPGALALVTTQKPVMGSDGTIEKWVPFSRIVLNQDTGGAIRGPGRADLFWGNGLYAEIAAGHLQHPGQFYFFVLNPDT